MALSRLIEWLARIMAILGGLVLVALTVVTVVSVTGRGFSRFGLGPIPGDYELIEAGTGFAVFAFLPWCQLKRGHASVEILTSQFSNRVNRLIDVVANLLMLVAAVLICWRQYEGTLDKYAYGETTFILQFPVWWAFAAGLSGAAAFVIVSAWCLWRSLVELKDNAEIGETGAVH